MSWKCLKRPFLKCNLTCVDYDVKFTNNTLLLSSGVDVEGLYRLAGFHDDIEAVRVAFDKGNFICVLI